MKEVKFCKDCKFSVTYSDEHTLYCINANVNADDRWALSAREFRGTTCNSEREKNAWIAICGKKGKMYEPKINL